MSKIICDVCGTAYPDTASQCPICGTAKPDVSSQSVGDNNEHHAYVKGGRFSTANVRKRNAGMQEAPRVSHSSHTEHQRPAHNCEYEEEDMDRQDLAYSYEDEDMGRQKPVSSHDEGADRRRPAHTNAHEPQKHKSSNHAPARSQDDIRQSNKILMIIVGVLLAAIIVICAYIAIRIINLSKEGGHEPNASHSTLTPGEHVPCTNISLQQTELTFTAPNETKLLSPILEPSNTTETVYYSSTNENIVKVSDKGNVTPVADGEAIIRITCGGHTVECKIVCNIGVKPVDPNPSKPTEPEPTQPSQPTIALELNRTDFTLNGYGSAWTLYDGPLEPSDITWTSDDPSIATVVNGKVTAVGNGKTKIRAEYQGSTATCIVRCTGVKAPVESNYELSHTDVTIKVGETFTISLNSKADGSKVNVTFKAKNAGVCTVDERGRVKGASVGSTVVYAEYQGVVYECTVRVTSA